jgi:hypothetical protein
VVRGGGGIVPDIVIRPDTLTAAERDFAKVLGSKLPVYRDVLTTYALELKRSKALQNESFKVAPEMRQEVYQRLKAKGVDVTLAQLNAAGQLVDEQLGYEITRYLFGRPAEFRRRSLDDRQLQTAIALLRKAQTPKDLMGLAMASAGAAGTN